MNDALDTSTAVPLSPGQERLWFLSQLAPLSTSYVVASRFRVAGPLDLNLLEDTVREITGRHEVLRSAFVTRRGRPVQVTSDPHPFRLVDLDELDAAEREQAWERLSKEETDRPFDLAAGPLFRFTVARMGDQDHRLNLAMHHIISDKYSVDIMLAEIAEIYAARLRGEPPELPALPIQYADFARWQQDWLTGPECAEHVAYWRGQLAGAPPRMRLGEVRRPARQEAPAEAVSEQFDLPAATVGRLREFAADESASTFMVLTTAYGLAVGRCYDLSDIVIACPVSSRPTPDTERLIGFFVNTVPIRIRLRAAMSFRELTGQVRETVLGALEHLELPFDRIVSALRPARTPGQTPFFQVVLNYTHHEEGRMSFPGLEVTEVPAHPVAARTEFALDVIETRAGLAGELICDSRVQDRDAALRLLATLCAVLDTALTAPGRSVA
jgi:Condensation domain